ncbi:MAG: hypothetical protein OWQ57_03085 [Sulfobacillus sp.]|nr:hypothetical protein [Sulfobacillus sp.]
MPLEPRIVMLTYDDMRRQMERHVKLIDVRTPEQFVQLHLVGSIPLPGPRFGMSLLADGQIRPEERIVIVSDDAVSGHIAAQEANLMGAEVVGIFASLPRSWEKRGLPVIKGDVVHPDTLLTYLHDNPQVEFVDVREEMEQIRFPFPPVTRSIPFSLWPEEARLLDPARPVLLMSGKDQRSILAARHLMVQGFARVGYLVGGYHRYHHPRVYDPKEAARTTARHGVFI